VGYLVAAKLLDDRLWEIIEALLPRHKRRFRYPGRKRTDDRRCLTGILFVLRTGIPWEYLPLEMGCGSGVTCWRRLRDWQEAGVWHELHRVLLEHLNQAAAIDWERAVVDSTHVRAVGAGGKKRPKSRGSQSPRKQASLAHGR
jgi:transposase